MFINGKINLAFMLMICILSLSTMVNAATELVLVKGGKPKATLVLAVKPRQAAKLAAAEFQHYIKKMTGCRLPEATDKDDIKGTRVLIGESTYTRALGYKNEDFLKDESIIKTGPDYLLIMGRDRDSYGPISYNKGPFYPEYNTSHDTGTVYGVIDFLERECGVRWYMPGEVGEIVPLKKDIVVKKMNLKRRPWAINRQMRNVMFPKNFYWWDKTKKLKRKDLVNYWAKDGAQRWYLRMKVKCEPFYSGHATVPFYKKFHKTHPEYFAQGYPLNSSSQLCLTNPNVIREIAKTAREYFNQTKEKQWSLWHAWGNYFPVSPNDNNNWCKCSRCQAEISKPKFTSRSFWNGKASKYVWNFVNAVAREVKKTHPNKWVSCYAYWDYFLPPKGLKLEPNIAVHFCRPMPCAWDPALAEKFEKSFLIWSKLTKRIYLYEYFCFPQTSGKFSVFPLFAPHKIAKDLSHKKRMGLKGAFNDITWAPNQFYVWPNPIMDQVNFYVWLKYLDNADKNVDELLNEFYELFYGPAGKYIEAFITKAENIYWDSSNYTALIRKGREHLDEKTSWEVMCPPKTLREFGKIIASAHAAAKTSKQKARVKLFDNGVYQMMKYSSKRYFEKLDETISLKNAQKLPKKWKVMPDPDKKGIKRKWFNVDFNDNLWKEVSTFKFLEKQGYKNYKHAWYRTDISISKKHIGEKVILRFGAVDETCWLWINGKVAGEFFYNPTLDPASWENPLRFDITKFVKFGKTNQITVLVQNLSGAGGIWKPSYILYKSKNWNPPGWCKVVSQP